MNNACSTEEQQEKLTEYFFREKVFPWVAIEHEDDGVEAMTVEGCGDAAIGSAALGNVARYGRVERAADEEGLLHLMQESELERVMESKPRVCLLE
jgi:hypothetical protein